MSHIGSAESVRESTMKPSTTHRVIPEKRWASGEWFRSGATWKVGRGRVYHFRPGHETFRIYKELIPHRILTNALRWLASAKA